MKLSVFRHNWGLAAGTWEEKLTAIKSAGYAGIETGALKPEDVNRFRELLQKFGLRFIPQIFTSGVTVPDHIQSFRRQLEVFKIFEPARVNCQSGSDSWSLTEATAFFCEVTRTEADFAFPVVHETHRGRCFYNPWTTARLLEDIPKLRLCADYSHWVCVCERLLTTEESLLRLCAEHAWHIHARVGYENGPQVSDPRAPEWQIHVEAHERWWQWIWEAQLRQGRPEITLTPEFGPPTYLHVMPVTQEPVANLAEICSWQAARQSKRFEAWRISA